MASLGGQYPTSHASHFSEKNTSPEAPPWPARKTVRTVVCISYVGADRLHTLAIELSYADCVLLPPQSSWIIVSNSTILFNKWLLDIKQFHFRKPAIRLVEPKLNSSLPSTPSKNLVNCMQDASANESRPAILLTSWHLLFATVATQVLARTTTLLDSRKNVHMSANTYARAILPISIFYSLSLVTSNMAYLYLSVPFIQILKTTSPAVMLFVAWAAGTASPTLATVVNILWIVGSVMLASTGEIQFSLVGFLYQMGGIFAEAIRLILIQLVLSSDGLKMDPLVGLYYFAPACCLMNVLIALPTREAVDISWHAVQQVGIQLLFLNALVAFMLNVASLCLIGQTSGLVMTLTGILKNILLVIVSVMIWNTQITTIQVVGYTSALAGLMCYSLGYNQLVKMSQAGAARIRSWSGAHSPKGLPR
ncbi:DUF250 domain membrane protein [Metarhizium album ARSEF 1941]|uniref:DUF250 domain membrane protein n=1 Tax=Metarhizium album (strain ARSEF 1941) TaxID=1081103 RepID=A0A0B2WKT4_METAS|nr:DUF250 domain membrane protein [Metarhizium album ARSEF 1941]KHN94102.1 DUF250 domain membrane protein [Metarhizium album ARSEF 1941]